MAWPDDARLQDASNGIAVDPSSYNGIQDALASVAGSTLTLFGAFFSDDSDWAWNGAYWEYDGADAPFAYFHVPIRGLNAKITQVDFKVYYADDTDRDNLTCRLRGLTINHDSAGTAPSGADVSTVGPSAGSPTWDEISLTPLTYKQAVDEATILVVDTGAVALNGPRIRVAPPRVHLTYDAL